SSSRTEAWRIRRTQKSVDGEYGSSGVASAVSTTSTHHRPKVGAGVRKRGQMRVKIVSCRDARTCKTMQETPTISKNRGLTVEKFYELFRGDHGCEIGVDTLEGGAFVLGAGGACGVSDDDREIACIAGSAGVAFDAPVEVNACKHDDFDL